MHCVRGLDGLHIVKWENGLLYTILKHCEGRRVAIGALILTQISRLEGWSHGFPLTIPSRERQMILETRCI